MPLPSRNIRQQKLIFCNLLINIISIPLPQNIPSYPRLRPSTKLNVKIRHKLQRLASKNFLVDLQKNSITNVKIFISPLFGSICCHLLYNLGLQEPRRALLANTVSKSFQAFTSITYFNIKKRFELFGKPRSSIIRQGLISLLCM